MIKLHDAIGLSILVFEGLHALRKRSNAARDTGGDRASLRIVWLACVVGIALAFYLRKTSHDAHFELGPVGTTIALLLIAAGFALRVWAMNTLGRLFTVDVAIREGHELVVRGPFRFVRHPSYSGLVMMFVGWSLTFETTWSIPALLVPFLCALVYRMHVEEAVLAAAFGAEYVAYCTRRRRLVPGIY